MLEGLTRAKKHNGWSQHGSMQQFQRYSLSNHLHWLSRNQLGGYQSWSFIDTPTLAEAYAASLASLGKCDTIIAYLQNK